MVFRHILRPLRRLAAEFFYNFGLHCAKNQIRVILISDLVITSLFYPALAIYFSSQPLSHFGTRLHDSLFALNTHGALNPTDLGEIWEHLDAVRLREDSGAQARCGSERTIRLERILLPSIDPDHVFGALNKETLQATSNLQTRINSLLAGSSNDALDYVHDTTFNKEEIFMYSPLMHWYHGEEQLSADPNVIISINGARNTSKAGIPITNELTLAGRGPVDDTGRFYEADFLVLTYFFVETDCHANAKHSAWSQLLAEATSGLGTMKPSTNQPKLIALEYKTDKPTPSVSLLSNTLIACYIIIFVYFSGALRRIDTVHSRFGLAFTGIVEIIVSTITSVSVCALWGFRVTMVPWAILPVMIVFIGAEDMFILIQEVVSTSIALPVKERIAIGLSRGGTSNTFKVCAYNAIFGSMAYFATGAIKQFCIFTVVVLVAHWFLIHTFFVAVLAIDIQRLELADLLQQGPRIQSSASSPAKEQMIEEVASYESKGRWRFFRKDRAAKNGSLLVILSITAVLYYASQPNHPNTVRDMNMKPDPDAARASFIQAFGSTTSTAISALPTPDGSGSDHPMTLSQSASAKFWHVFNPDNDALLHMRIEAPTVVTLNPINDTPGAPVGQKRRALRRSLQPLMWIFKIVILPISATAVLLYFLLLYLLKDAELLEAQRNRAEAGSADPGELERERQRLAGQPLQGSATFATLSRAFVADVDLMTTSKDGRIIAAISSENEFAVWRMVEGTMQQLDCRVVFLSVLLAGVSQDKETALEFTSIALDDDGERCAVGTTDGHIIEWPLDRGPQHKSSTKCSSSSPIAHLAYLPKPGISMSASVSTIKPTDPLTPRQSRPPIRILATSRDGSASIWNAAEPQPPEALPLSGQIAPVPPAYFVDQEKRLKIVCALPVGLQVLTGLMEDDSDWVVEWDSRIIPNVIDDLDEIKSLQIDGIFVGPRYMELVAIATAGGRIIVYNCAEAGQPICSVNDSLDSVSQLRLAAVPWKHCTRCGEMEPDSFILGFSVGSLVQVYRVVALLVPNRCSCPMTVLHRSLGSKNGLREKYQQRSRTGSISASSSPVAHRKSLSSTSSKPAADYPLPGHGYHSRRTSDRDLKSRQSLESTSDGTDFDGDSIHEFSATLAVPGMGDSPARLRTNLAWTGLKPVKVAEIPCERGVWDVVGSHIVGVRRRPRSTSSTKPGDAATDSSIKLASHSPFARWETWSLDALTGTIRSSPLPLLRPPDKGSHTPPANGHRAWSDNSIVRRSSGVRRLMELSNGDLPGPSTPRTSLLPPSTTITAFTECPVLPFTRVSTLDIAGNRVTLGLGNTVGIVELDFKPRADQPLEHARRAPSLFSFAAFEKKRT